MTPGSGSSLSLLLISLVTLSVWVFEGPGQILRISLRHLDNAFFQICMKERGELLTMASFPCPWSTQRPAGSSGRVALTAMNEKICPLEPRDSARRLFGLHLVLVSVLASEGSHQAQTGRLHWPWQQQR